MPSISQRKRLRALKRRRERRTRGEFLLEGPRALAEVVEAGCRVTLVLYTERAAAQPDGRRLLERLEAAQIECEMVSEGDLLKLADTVTPQGWLAVGSAPDWTWADLPAGNTLVLDGLQDPGNVGTLIRAAEALGGAGAVLLPGTADPLGPKAIRAAAGSSVRLPLLESSWDEARDRLRDAGAAIWIATAAGEPLGRTGERPDFPVALVLGNEGAGVSEAVLGDADRAVAIPMCGRVESLNAAIAGAILMDRVFGA